MSADKPILYTTVIRCDETGKLKSDGLSGDPLPFASSMNAPRKDPDCVIHDSILHGQKVITVGVEVALLPRDPDTGKFAEGWGEKFDELAFAQAATIFEANTRAPSS